ncbi:CHASE3 domain-containing protein [Halomonas sp. LY9]
MRRTFVVKMLLGAAIPLCMTLASGVALYLALQSSLSASGKMLQQQAIIASANSLKLRFVDAETGQRGYVLTGRGEFLLPYEQASASFNLMFERLVSMVESQPEQLARLNNAGNLFVRWQREAASLSIERRREGISAPDIENLERGKQLVDSFRLLMNELTDAANVLL